MPGERNIGDVFRFQGRGKGLLFLGPLKGQGKRRRGNEFAADFYGG